MEKQQSLSAYMPIKPNGTWWVAGCDETPADAMGAVSAREGCISWEACQEIGWRIVLVRITEQ